VADFPDESKPDIRLSAASAISCWPMMMLMAGTENRGSEYESKGQGGGDDACWSRHVELL
jgi:hypothetical protein